ncbi:Phage minor structural protein GP20 [uncultured Roseburia sp.]|uniref:Phage scaffolding protein n=1 Tax=Brotonthovivens ammoniilytica TaxID=2981725 RepID=A0ABT2TJ87_9FIRM|nr:phage scaffolding protein [Brotonthovivens ammoniilytica]MCU6762280.1 phage scaffolding protein [Brotonthovivens ammoniilytica]SCI61137.1 Phage minor structural protein GP20 [uncultured Roseburia sp.]
MEFLREVLGNEYTGFEEAVRIWNEKPENQSRPIRIVNAGSAGYMNQSELRTLKEENGKLKSQLQSAKDMLKSFEGTEVKALVAKIDMLTTSLDTQKEDYEKRIEDMEFDYELKSAIETVGGRNMKAIQALLDIDSLRKSKDRAMDIQTAIENCWQENAYLFGADEPINNPIAPTGGIGNYIDSETATLRISMGLSAEDKR